MEPEIPAHLVDQITAGRCVAFVGAGFSAPAVPAWRALLEGLAEKAVLDDDTRRWLADLVAAGGHRDLEAAAQVLQVAMGPDFDPALAEVLVERGHPERIAERRRLLAGIPFDAILTTNFDHFLMGEVPGPAAYQRVLRDPPRRWWEPRFWEGDQGAPVVKLHGEVGPVGDDVVFTQRDYRERLYSSPAYMTFLRSLFATHTVLYLGVSFTDAYLNELRSEVLAMIDHDGSGDPVAYALLADVQPHQERYLRTHEGLQVLGFDTAGGTDWSGFESILRGVHDRTNPRAILGRVLDGRTVVWVDSDPDDTAYGASTLRDAAKATGGRSRMVQRPTVEAGLESVAADGADLVVVDLPQAEALLVEVRRRDLRVPVIVLAAGADALPQRPTLLALGASDAVTQWGELFREIERVLAAGA